MHFWVWLALAGGFIVLEILTMSLIFMSFALAALVGALAAGLWIDSPAQWIGFALSAVLTLGIIRPFVRKYLSRKTIGGETGMDALIFSEAITLSEVNSIGGTIRLRNETWSARCESEAIPERTEVIVTHIDGAVALVIRKHSGPKA